MQNHLVTIDVRGLAGVIQRFDRVGGPLPQLTSSGSIESGHYAADAKREESSISVGRRRLRSGAVIPSRRHHVERRRILRAPAGLTRPGIKRRHHLVVTLTRKHVDDVADENGRGVAEPDIDLPLLV